MFQEVNLVGKNLHSRQVLGKKIELTDTSAMVKILAKSDGRSYCQICCLKKLFEGDDLNLMS